MLDKLYSSTSTKALSALALAAALAITLSSGHAQSALAADSLLVPGDSVVTGFSGTVPSTSPSSALDRSLQGQFIDLQGPSAQILSLRGFGSAPRGTLSDAVAKRRITAGEVGQVFAIALDDGQGHEPPYIYLGSTSYFGLEIVVPDRDGDGKADRVKIGHPEAKWMPGQFGSNGRPGSIWRVDGKTGEVTLFASLPSNSGAGVGDIVFDQTTRQLFVSDLDDGLIYRISLDGTIIGSFDHGSDGRPAAGLAAIEDDGRAANITSSAFNGADPATWGYTQKHRRVAGMAHYNGRLYYAVADGPQIWSVGVAQDGGFLNDARLELKVEGLPGTGPITDMLFDKSGRLYLAQRGEQRAGDGRSRFADAGASAIVRYRRSASTGNDANPVWIRDGKDYAIGMMPGHKQSNGGIALGYQHDQNGALQRSRPDAMLWATGDRLRPSAPVSDQTSAEEHSDVHGLQGTDVSLVRPLNVPPAQSYFIDYDGRFGDPARSGHMGDVEIWQSDGIETLQAANSSSAEPGAEILDAPGFQRPADTHLPGIPPEFITPKSPLKANLKLTKRVIPKTCKSRPSGWKCRYRIRIKNTGPDTYLGPIRISERLVNAGGASLSFSSSWSCWTVGTARYRCLKPNVVLPKGSSIALTATALVPKSFGRCRLKNVAKILRAPGGSRWNTNPADDRDTAVAKIPKDDCLPEVTKPTNLSLKKEALSCGEYQGDVVCSYKITVTNTGPNAYSGPLVVRDVPQAGAISTNFWTVPWACTPGTGNGFKCAHGPTSLAPGSTATLLSWTRASKQVVRNNKCRMTNRAQIVRAPGGSVRNQNPLDDSAIAIATVPEEICNPDRPGTEFDPEPMPRHSNLKIEKLAGEACKPSGGAQWCTEWRVRVINTGPATFSDVIRFREIIPAGAIITSLSPELTCSGSLCETNAPIALTASPAAGSFKSFYLHLSGSASLAKRLKCKLTNRVKIISPAGIPNKNTDRSDDHARDTASLPSKYCSQNPLTHNPAPGPGKTTSTSEHCRPGHTLVHGHCKRKAVHCPRGLKKVSSSRVGTLRNDGWTIRRVGHGGRALWCGKPGRKPAFKCRSGWKKVASKHRIPRGWKRYSVGRGSALIWCAKKVRKPVFKCRRPARWNGKKCVCPGHKLWNGKRCVAQKARASRKCKAGFIGRAPNCRRISVPKRNKHQARSRRKRH